MTSTEFYIPVNPVSQKHKYMAHLSISAHCELSVVDIKVVDIMTPALIVKSSDAGSTLIGEFYCHHEDTVEMIPAEKEKL